MGAIPGVVLYNFDAASGNIFLIGSMTSSVDGISVAKAQCVSSDSNFKKLNFAVSGGKFISYNIL